MIKDIQTKGLTPAEVAAAKRTIISHYTVDLASTDEVTSATLGNAVYDLNPNEISEFPKKIQAVTIEQVNKAAKELLRPDQFVIVTAGPNKN